MPVRDRFMVTKKDDRKHCLSGACNQFSSSVVIFGQSSGRSARSFVAHRFVRLKLQQRDLIPESAKVLFDCDQIIQCNNANAQMADSDPFGSIRKLVVRAERFDPPREVERTKVVFKSEVCADGQALCVNAKCQISGAPRSVGCRSKSTSAAPGLSYLRAGWPQITFWLLARDLPCQVADPAWVHSV